MKILIVRVSSLGDVLHTMPMVADIRQHFPEAQIDWVVEEAYVGLLRLNPQVNRILPFALRRWKKRLFSREIRQEMTAFGRQLHETTYDVVLDVQGLIKTGIVMGLAKTVKGGIKAGLANATEGSGYEPLSRFFHNKSIPVNARTHAVARGRILAGKVLGYEPTTVPDFALRVPDVECPVKVNAPYTLFFHGTAGISKKWAPANWIATGRSLASQGMQVLLPWGNPTEHELARVLAGQIPGAVVLPALSVEQMIVLMQGASLIVGLDTGFTHIAAAYCRPTIEIYCDSPRWKTEGNWSDKIINLGDKGAPPTAEQVLGAVGQLYQPDASGLKSPT